MSGGGADVDARGRRIRLRGIVGAICTIVFCAIVIGANLVRGFPLETDIESILPVQPIPIAVREGLHRASEIATNRIAILVTADDQATSESAVADLTKRLTEQELFTADGAEGETIGRWLFANRHELVCELSPRAFDAAAGERIRHKALASLFGVGAPVTGDLLRADPFLYTFQLAKCLSGQGSAPPEGSAIVSGALRQSAFRMDTQASVGAVLQGWQQTWESQGIRMDRSGAIFHAEHAASSAKTEMSTIGGLGLLGVTILYWLAFGRVRNVAQVAALIAISFSFGLSVALLVFGELHVLTLVLSAMLVGVVSDYALHMMGAGAGENWPDPDLRWSHLVRPMTVSMLTTAAGFVGLLFLGVSIFQQLAVLSIAGIACAWALVLFVFLPNDAAPRKRELAIARWRGVESFARVFFNGWRKLLIAAALVLAATGTGLVSARTLDDVRQFQARDAQLEAEDAAVRSATGQDGSMILMLTEGSTLEEAKQREEDALATLPPSASAFALTRFDPSGTRRSLNRAALNRFLEQPFLAAQRALLGLPGESAPEKTSAELPDILAGLHIASEDGRHYLIARLSAAEGWDVPAIPGVRIIDAAATYSDAFARYRELASACLVIAIIAAAFFILAVYRKFSALSMVLAPALAILGGIFIPAAFGFPVSFFSVAGAMVLFGVGIDYSAFMWEAGSRSENWSKASVFLGALTTLLSMGLLALSETYPVRSFGLTIASGVACAFLFSTFPYFVARKVTLNAN